MWIPVLLALAVAATNATGLKVGDSAPGFAAPAASGKTIKLSDFKGQWVVLYFYPKAGTPKCTQEACSLRDGYAETQKAGAVIVGVSLDDLDVLQKFQQTESLPFELLSDSKKQVSRAYGVLGLGGLFAQRRTFLIDPQGRIAYIFEEVNPAGHSRQVLDVLARLQAQPAP